MKTTKLDNFIKALDRLKEGLNEFNENNALERDGIIQRYEFTFELSWKALKELFEDEGLIDLNTPKIILREAFSMALIDNQNIWLNMLMDRNYTSHIYSENLAIDICRNIKTQYVFELEKLKNKILERKEKYR